MFLRFKTILVFFFFVLFHRETQAINPVDSTGGSTDAKVGIEALSGDNNKIVFQETSSTPQITEEQVLPIASKIFGEKSKKLLTEHQMEVASLCVLILNSYGKIEDSSKELDHGIKSTEKLHGPGTGFFGGAEGLINFAIQRFMDDGILSDKEISEKIRQINQSDKTNLKINTTDTLGEVLGTINIYAALKQGFSEKMERKWHDALKIILKKQDGQTDETVTPITGVARMFAICNTSNNDQLIKLPAYNSKEPLKKAFLEYYNDPSKMLQDFKNHMKISSDSIKQLLPLLKSNRKEITQLLMYILMQPNNLEKFQKEFREWIPDDSYYSKNKDGHLLNPNNIFSLSDGSALQYHQFAKMLNPSLQLSPALTEDKTPNSDDKKTDQQEKKPLEVDISKIIESLDSTIKQLKKLISPEADGSTGGKGEKNVDMKRVKGNIKNMKDSSEYKIKEFLDNLYDGKIDKGKAKDLKSLSDNVNKDLKNLKKAIDEFIETYNFYRKKGNLLFDGSNDNFPIENEEILKKLFQDYKKDSSNDFKKAIISIVAHNLTKEGGIPEMKSFTGLLASNGALIRQRKYTPSRSWIASNINIYSYEDAKLKLNSVLKDSSSNPLDNLPSSISSSSSPDSIKQAITEIETQKSALESLKNKIKDIKQDEQEDRDEKEDREDKDKKDEKGFITSFVSSVINSILKRFNIIEQKIMNKIFFYFKKLLPINAT